MTISMTGFSRVQAESENLGTLSIELKAVNSRYLDVFFKIPETIKPFEASLRQLLGKQLTRGKIECSIRYYPHAREQISINHDYVTALLKTSQQLADTHNLQTVSVGEILRFPNALTEQSPDMEALKDWLLPLFEKAITELFEQRQKEGAHLHQLLSERLLSVREIVADVAVNYRQSIDLIQQKITDKLEKLAEKYQSDVDEIRFEQELIYLLQKMDIAEEIDRLTGHINTVEELLLANVPVGRKLDFLMQEMNRESNTIGSKSQSLGVTMNAVDLKVLLEQMREQIQNVE